MIALARRPLVVAAVALAGVLAALMALAYIGGFTDPIGHLEGLPVAVVASDAAVDVAGQRIDVGDQVVAQLEDVRQVEVVMLPDEAAARRALAENRVVGAVLLPSDLSASVADVATSLGASDPATVTVVVNEGAGSLQPAVVEQLARTLQGQLDEAVGGQLASTLDDAGVTVPAGQAATIARPVHVEVTADPALGDHAGRGLPPFYLAVVVTLTGVLGITAVHTVVGALAGREEIVVAGRPLRVATAPVSTGRRFALEAALAVPVGVVGGVAAVAMAAGPLGTDVDRPVAAGLLAIGGVVALAWVTLALLTALGIVGDLVAVLLTTIFGVPTARGVYPVEALPGPYQALGRVLPLRWLTDGMRAAFYFEGRAAAGLTGAWAAVVVTGAVGLLAGVGAARLVAAREVVAAGDDAALDEPTPAADGA